MNQSEYKGWVFMPSWETLLQGFPPDKAKEILWQIKEIGVGKELSTNDEMIKSIINGAIRPNLIAAQERYKSACNGGRPMRDDVTIEKIKHYQDMGWTLDQIAIELKCSTSTIKNRIKESDI